MKPQPKGIKRVVKTQKAEEEQFVRKTVSFVDESNSDLPYFALHKLLEHLTSRPNILTILSINPRYHDYVEEFNKFLELIENLEEPGQSQLAASIFPVFVHFYLNMVNKIDDAERFYHKFAPTFHSAEGYTGVLKELYKIKSRKEIKRHGYFSIYRKRKYILRIFPSVLDKLSSFLEDIESKALWQTFCLFFYFEHPDLEIFKVKKKRRKKSKKVKSKYSKSKRAAKAARSATEELVASPTAAENEGTATEKSVECSTSQELAIENTMQIQGNEDSSDDLTLPPILETVFEWLDSNVLAVDLNHNESELCVTFGHPYILVIPLKKRNSSHEEVCESDPLFSNKFVNCGHGSRDEMEVDLTERDQFYHQWRTVFINNWKEIVKDVSKPIRIPFPEFVRAAKYFPNNPHLLLTAYGKEITSLDTTTMANTSFGKGHHSEVWDIDINSSGSFFCTAGYDMNCCLWSYDDKSAPLRTYEGHENIVTAVKFHPNGYYFFSGSYDYTVRLWNIESSMCLRSLVDHESEVTLVACSPDNQTLASADTAGVVKLWDVEQNDRICDLQCYMNNTYDGSKITSMCFTKEHFLAMCSSKGVVRIWDVRKLDSVYSMYNKVHPAHVPVFLKTSNHGELNVVLQDDMTNNWESLY